MQSYAHFNLEERESLRVMREEGKGIRAMARALGRSPSSVSREIARNRNKDGRYHAWRATTLYLQRRKQCRRGYRVTSDEALAAFCTQCLDKYWSPEIIVERWKQANPEAHLSHSTVYAALRRGELPGYRPKTHLRRRGKQTYVRGASATIRPDRRIGERCEEANRRERIGDWEGDTVYGAVNKGHLLTCVDRKSKYLLADKLPNRCKETLREALIKMLRGQPAKTLTLDNGAEFADFRAVERELTGLEIYFADPHAPWQRGSNENINGLLRFFFPKGTDFNAVSQEELDAVLLLINTRPRKCLAWLSPADVFSARCCT